MTRVQKAVKRPKVLLVATYRWPLAARLGIALSAAGCAVEAVAPAGHPILTTRSLERHWSFNALFPLRSIVRATEGAEPDLLVPCDDGATAHLHALSRARLAIDIRPLIEISLGPRFGFKTTASRCALAALAEREKVATPLTSRISSRLALHSWIAQHGLPAFLKADGTSGGIGVKKISTTAEAEQAFRVLSAPPSLARVVKRSVVNHDLTLVIPALRQSSAGVSIQQAIAGREANSAVFCWRGEVLAGISVHVLRTRYPGGPSTVVRCTENEQMTASARKLAKALHLSGFYGLDFMIEESSGTAYLLELNARVTQIAHLALGEGHDLAAVAASALGESRLRPRPKVTENDTIALFPGEMLSDPESPFLSSGYHDLPVDEPGLIQWGQTADSGWDRLLTPSFWKERKEQRLRSGKTSERLQPTSREGHQTV